MKVGIDSLSFFIPNIHLPIQTLAMERNIEPNKLIKGLGLQKMVLMDTNQDVITMAANAAYQLLQDNPNINPQDIAKIYVGSESSLDNSKPIASYVLGLLEQVYPVNSFLHCDAVDHTFACIGGVDAMQNAMDFVRANPSKKAIVITTDNAKYDLESTGEYTQGAGSIALLISSNPRMLSFNSPSGVATKSVFDFFKPYQTIKKESITGESKNEPWFNILENEISIHKEQPVFDGQYSNECYIERINQAYENFKEVNNLKQKDYYQNWEAILMHLPYCFQGRRTFQEIVLGENPSLIDQNSPDKNQLIKEFTKSAAYLNIVENKIAPSEIASSQVGNIYTGSIFLGLLSTLTYFQEINKPIQGTTLGFIAYGSGSKSKVFEAYVEKDWQLGLPKISISTALENSKAIDFPTYIALHKKELDSVIFPEKNRFVLDSIEKDNPNLLGARYYSFNA